jgi:hypothetical protein
MLSASTFAFTCATSAPTFGLALTSTCPHLKGSYLKAFNAHFVQLQHKAKGGDANSRTLLASIDEVMERDQATRCGEMWKQQKTVDVVTMSWVDFALMIDPELVAEKGPKGGMATCCWNCGETESKLLECTLCKRAKYCSK